MKVIVDTSVWSLALRRNSLEKDTGIVQELRALVEESRVQMLGIIRQELLSGIKNTDQFNKLKTKLLAFPDLVLTTDDHELAAEYFNLCRGKGVQGSVIDFLICAISSRYQYPIFTTDNDFKNYAKVIPIVLHEFSRIKQYTV